MSYIGKEPINGNFSVADAITTSSTATYALTVGSVAFTPESVNHCIVSLNGVIQAPTSAFTISGTNIVFNSALTSADVIDFIYFLGHVNDIGTPSDNTVSLAKMAANSIDSAQYVDGSIDLAHMSSESVDEDNLHISNAGTNGQFLSKQSGNSGGLTWADAGGGGKILQVQNTTHATQENITATGSSFADTGGTVSITPSATSSHIIVHFSVPFYAYRSSSDSARFNWRIIRTISSSDTTLAEGVHGWAYGYWDGGNSAERVWGTILNYQVFDSPNTTSACVYKMQMVNYESGTLYVQIGTSPTEINAMEIDGS